MSIQVPLNSLESAGLIDLLRTEPDLEYGFRHALIQDAAYDSLLKTERQQLHRLAGEVLERLYPDRIEELSPRLGEHFRQAGDSLRAAHYYQMAAQSAARQFANAEAILLYSHALECTSSPVEQASFYLERGSLNDISGYFEKARLDFENAFALAHENQEPHLEWQSLVNLGGLWAARDYHHTGTYYQQALDLARSLDDERLLAHSLNRLANFYTNTEQPDAAMQHHNEALAIFKRLEDTTGIAETVDLLAMASSLGGDLVLGRQYMDQAIDLFTRLDNPMGLATNLTLMAVTTPNIQTFALYTPIDDPEDGIHHSRAALEIARRIGHRPGEAFSLIALGESLITKGEFSQALEALRQGLEIANQIQHQQWQLYALLVTGSLYMEMLDYEQARLHLERSLELAQTNYSLHWTNVTAGALALCYLSAGQTNKADEVLNQILKMNTPMRTMGQRTCWLAYAELQLAKGYPEQALDLVNRLSGSAANAGSGKIIFQLEYLRGRALAGMGLQEAVQTEKSSSLNQAQSALQTATREAQRIGYRARLWHIQLDLAKVYTAMGEQSLAEKQRQEARIILSQLASSITESDLRQQFLERSLGEAS